MLLAKSVVMLISTTIGYDTHHGPTSFYDSMEQCTAHQIKLVKSVPDIALDIKCLKITPPITEPDCKD